MILLLACTEYGVQQPDLPAPATPPGIDPDADFGEPPDWTTCSLGYYAQYFNLPADHPDVEPETADAPGPPDTLDWWSADYLAFRDFDGSLDFGANWWPVDEGVAGDPLYFSARWTAWIRAWSSTRVEVVMGSADDAWVITGDAVSVALPGVHAFEPATYTFDLASGQHPLDIRFAQREGGDSAFRFRVSGGDVSICYPDFSGE